MEQTRRRIYIDNHRFTLQAPGLWLKYLPYRNGLIVMNGADGASILTGTPSGYIWLTIELHNGEPPIDLEPWDEVVEVCYQCTTGKIDVVVEGVGDLSDFPNLAFDGSGDYQLRAHARGRARALTEAALTLDEVPVEEHLIQIWKISFPVGDVVLKTSDGVGTFK